jgi:hypothetical protein
MINKLVGVLLLVGAAFYVYELFRQIQATSDLCDRYPIGSQVEEAGIIGESFGLDSRGPFKIDGRPGAARVIFCASFTMCDKACLLEIEDGRVTRSQHMDL